MGYDQFGVPSTDLVCDLCKEYMIKHNTPKILSYNRFKLIFTEIMEAPK